MKVQELAEQWSGSLKNINNFKHKAKLDMLRGAESVLMAIIETGEENVKYVSELSYLEKYLHKKLENKPKIANKVKTNNVYYLILNVQKVRNR